MYIFTYLLSYINKDMVSFITRALYALVLMFDGNIMGKLR